MEFATVEGKKDFTCAIRFWVSAVTLEVFPNFNSKYYQR